jgi:hypothetical protein
MDSIGLMRELMMVRSVKRRYQLLGRLARRLGFEYRAECERMPTYTVKALNGSAAGAEPVYTSAYKRRYITASDNIL